MKISLLKSAVLLLAMAAVFVSCKKDDTSSEEENTNTNTFTEKITWDAEGSSHTASLIQANYFGNTIIITGSTGSNKPQINLNIDDDVPVGTEGWASVYCTHTNNGVSYTGTSGSVIITKFDQSKKQIVGTFEFTGEDLTGGSGNTVEVTNGTFSVEY